MNKTRHVHPLATATPVSSIMTNEFAVVRETLGLDPLARFLLERAITCAAVADQGGKLIGDVSMIDLVRHRYMNGETEDDASGEAEITDTVDDELVSGFHLEPARCATVRDIMMPFVLRLPDTATIDQAASLMAFEGVHRVLVVKDGAVVGVVSALDVLRWVGDRDGHVAPRSARSRWRDACEYVT